MTTRPFLALAACTLLAASSQTGGPLAGADLSRHITGPKVKAEDMLGKVVFVEYWGRN